MLVEGGGRREILEEEFWNWNPRGGIPEEDIRRRNLGRGILEEESLRMNPRGGILEKESWRNPGGGILKDGPRGRILEEASWRGNIGIGILKEEA